MDPHLRNDTRIGEQPALRTSSGRSWLVMGALAMVVCGGLLLALSTRQPTMGFVGAGVVVVLYVFMVAALAIRNTRARLVTLAALMVAMVATALIFVLVITTAEWSAVL